MTAISLLVRVTPWLTGCPYDGSPGPALNSFVRECALSGTYDQASRLIIKQFGRVDQRLHRACQPPCRPPACVLESGANLLGMRVTLGRDDGNSPRFPKDTHAAKRTDALLGAPLHVSVELPVSLCHRARLPGERSVAPERDQSPHLNGLLLWRSTARP